ncbi:MAG: hypothetical protein IKH30_15880 [Clostridia bacterium]|nr:hypothetical protein [Clostridia bacterium]
MRASERERQDMLDGELPQLEKKDLLAMYFSGFLVIGLPCLLLILIIVGVTFLLFTH